MSGADIKAMCTEAGLIALRERRMRVSKDDFDKAKEKVLYLKKGDIPEGLYIWFCVFYTFAYKLIIFFITLNEKFKKYSLYY